MERSNDRKAHLQLAQPTSLTYEFLLSSWSIGASSLL